MAVPLPRADVGPAEPAPRPRAYPAAIDWRIAIPERPLWSLMDDAAARFPDRPCTDFLGKLLTYRQITDAIDRASEGFRRLGVRSGDRVGLLLPNCPYFVICFFAILRAGGIVTTINPLAAEPEVRRQIDDSGATIVVTVDLAALYGKLAPALGATTLRKIVLCRFDDALPKFKALWFRLRWARSLVRMREDEQHVPFARLIAQRGDGAAADVDPARDAAALLYTGGTTGHPKGVILTHANLLANALQMRAWFSKAEHGNERVLAILPFSHSFGLSAVMNLAIGLGAMLIILPRFAVRQTLRTIHRQRPTLFAGVPTIFRALADAPDVKRYDLSSLKVCISGGDALPRGLHDVFRERTGVTVTEGYGLTECAPVASCGNPLEDADRPGSVGLPIPGTTIEIVSLADGVTILAPDERGEICIRGPQVMAGYWQHAELTGEALRGGRLHSGDVGYRDADGYVYVVDRVKDIIITGGYTVYPAMVEQAIRAHEDVADVAVVGLPDDYWGQRVTAFVVPAAGRQPSAEGLLRFLDARLAPFERPKAIEFRQSLPKSLIGKVLRRELRA